MALIKCPECGKEVSDRAISCPNCGCPITKEVIDTPQNKEAKPIEKEEVEYYNGEIENTRCRLTSSVWSFNSITIPVKSISAVSLEANKVDTKLYNRIIWAFFSLILLIDLLSTSDFGSNSFYFGDESWIGYGEWGYDVLLFWGLAAIGSLVVYIVDKLYSFEGMTVISHSGVRTTVAKTKGDYHETMLELEKAALLCLKENA